ncbi:hypothetical protein ACFQWB_07790 [Paenibacillus thermoaerophilus]|uniref:Uncharacterized protein n=1 Tax=Paenibacillus thermoaerophilus TaxID=1215385 RepID=A0ABW2V109_9BACL|nr:hypothetical protein [Paenibacillus thermoaerophilus]TMV18379.1 hypothetical protein FE781_02885 [Paenibacillus thermoaerophilus]
MPIYWLIALLAVIAATGLIATIQVGRSRENREGNPQYDAQTGANWIRLLLLYVAGGIAGVAILLAIWLNL